MSQLADLLRQRGLDEKDLARLTGLPIKDIAARDDLSGLSSADLNTLAEVLGVPPFALLQEKPRSLEELPQDFRTERNRAVLHTVQSLQAIYKTYDAASTLDWLTSRVKLERKRLPRFTTQDATDLVAKAVATHLGVGAAELSEYEDPMRAFYRVRFDIEQLGIFVFAERVSDGSLKGFCVSTKDNNYITINALKTSYRSRIFTLVHEFVHLLLRAPGIGDPLSNRLDIERYCNKVVAEYLLPFTALEGILELTPKSLLADPVRLIDHLYGRLPYSKYFLAIRLSELGGTYRRYASRWLESVGLSAVSGSASQVEREDFSYAIDALDSDQEPSNEFRRVTQASYHSARLGFTAVNLAYAAFHQNVISIFDAGSGLGLPPKSFEKTHESIIRREREVQRNAPQ